MDIPAKRFLKRAPRAQISISGRRSPGGPGGRSFQAAPLSEADEAKESLTRPTRVAGSPYRVNRAFQLKEAKNAWQQCCVNRL